jgi:hypothetical protein
MPVRGLVFVGVACLADSDMVVVLGRLQELSMLAWRAVD